MRFQSPGSPIFLRACLMIALVVMVAGVAAADTIYLKNGRVIHTASAKRVGEKIEFEQFGQKVSVPVSVVLRIERDESAEDPALPTPTPAPTPAPTPPPTDAGDAADAPATDAGDGTGDEEELPPQSNPEYWRELILSIRSEKADLEEAMVVLRREERAFLFSKRSTAETRVKIEAVQSRDKELDQELIDLRREARRLGVPPGWLRVRGTA